MTTDVAYEVTGSGDHFVLVHGSTGGRATWMQQTPTLAERFTVVLPEYAGGGETPLPADGSPLTVELLVDQVLSVADEVGAERFHLAGYSLGAVVVAALAARAPERVRSLAVVNGWAKTDARMRWTFDLWERLYRTDKDLFTRYVLADGLGRESFDLFGDGVEAMVPMMATQFSAGSAEHANLDARIDIESELTKITAPTLVIGGLLDRWVDIAHSRSMADVIADAKLVELEVGHVSLTEKAPEITQLLLDHAAAH